MDPSQYHQSQESFMSFRSLPVASEVIAQAFFILVTVPGVCIIWKAPRQGTYGAYKSIVIVLASSSPMPSKLFMHILWIGGTISCGYMDKGRRIWATDSACQQCFPLNSAMELRRRFLTALMVGQRSLWKMQPLIYMALGNQYHTREPNYSWSLTFWL